MSGLIITRNVGEKLYGFVTEHLSSGDYIRIENFSNELSKEDLISINNNKRNMQGNRIC